MLVFRFEDDNGKGVYRNINFFNHKWSTGHPEPDKDITPDVKQLLEQWAIDDGQSSDDYYYADVMYYMAARCGYIKEKTDNIIFGFKSLEQAYVWFNKYEIIKILSNDVNLSIYNVPDEYVLELGRQVIYDKARAIKLINT